MNKSYRSLKEQGKRGRPRKTALVSAQQRRRDSNPPRDASSKTRLDLLSLRRPSYSPATRAPSSLPRRQFFPSLSLAMARATRSTTTHDIADKLPDHPPQTPRKGAAKKRKRNSDAENEDTLPAKQSRTDDKLEGSPNPGEEHSDNDKTTELPSSGLVPVLTADAANILDVLEMYVQRLLSPAAFLNTASGSIPKAFWIASSRSLSTMTIPQLPPRRHRRLRHRPCSLCAHC